MGQLLLEDSEWRLRKYSLNGTFSPLSGGAGAGSAVMGAVNFPKGPRMNRSRIPMIAMILVGTLALGAGAGAVTYSVAHPSSTKTVVQQVPVGSSEPAASASALTPGEIYR